MLEKKPDDFEIKQKISTNKNHQMNYKFSDTIDECLTFLSEETGLNKTQIIDFLIFDEFLRLKLKEGK